MQTSIRLLSLSVIVAALVWGCGGDKGPAELAIKGAEQAVNAVKEEAMKYVPDQLKSVEDALAVVKDQFSKGDYSASLTGAKDVTAKANELLTAVTAKKDELTKNWNEMSGGVKGMVDAIKNRVETLSASKKLPVNLSADKFEAAKSGLAAVTQEWTAASDAFKSGDLMDAITKGKSAKQKASEIMATLGLAAPAVEKSS